MARKPPTTLEQRVREQIAKLVAEGAQVRDEIETDDGVEIYYIPKGSTYQERTMVWR